MKIYVKTKFDTRMIEVMAERGMKQALKHAGGYVRKIAMNSIKQSDTPSAKGKPPHTRRGRLKKSILYAVDAAATSVVIGPSANLISSIGHYHEFGGTEQRKSRPRQYQIGMSGPVRVGKDGKLIFVKLSSDVMVAKAQRLDREYFSGKTKTRQYPRRPYMSNALERALPKASEFWRNMIREK